VVGFIRDIYPFLKIDFEVLLSMLFVDQTELAFGMIVEREKALQTLCYTFLSVIFNCYDFGKCILAFW
jgi:hypothetical protein